MPAHVVSFGASNHLLNTSQTSSNQLYAVFCAWDRWNIFTDIICDVIKQNESELANIDFEIH